MSASFVADQGPPEMLVRCALTEPAQTSSGPKSPGPGCANPEPEAHGFPGPCHLGRPSPSSPITVWNDAVARFHLPKLRYRPPVATDDPGPLALPPDGPLVLDSLELPAGRRIRAATDLSQMGQPEIDALWMTDNQVEDAGSKWWALHQENGLQPVLLNSLRDDAEVGDRRPWDSELVVWDAPVRGQDMVENTLAEFWTEDDYETC